MRTSLFAAMAFSLLSAIAFNFVKIAMVLFSSLTSDSTLDYAALASIIDDCLLLAVT